MTSEPLELSSFGKAITSIGMTVDDLRIEEVITSSMNNFVMNVNCNGVVWAVAIRYPRQMSVSEFIEQKERTARISQYLADEFGAGVELEPGERFVFDGRSYLTDADSTKLFLKSQADSPAIVVNDAIRNERKEIRGGAVEEEFLEYNGPFYISRGAPASETLLIDADFAPIMLRGLAAMHARTGASACPSVQDLTEGVTEVAWTLGEAVSAWRPEEGSSPSKRVADYVRRFGDQAEQAARRQAFVESADGRETLDSLIRQTFSRQCSDERYMSFVHGDAHGRNFIVVQFEYELVGARRIFVDRVFLNELFRARQDLNRATIDLSDESSSMTFRQYQRGDEANELCVSAVRRRHDEVHPIDIDTARGISAGERDCYLLDVATLCISADSWYEMHKSESKRMADLVSLYATEFQKHVRRT